MVYNEQKDLMEMMASLQGRLVNRRVQEMTG